MRPSVTAWQKVLAGRGPVYLVGGSARDIIIGRESSSGEVDMLVCSIPEKDLISILSGFGSARKTGKSFPVILFRERSGGAVYHISMPRKKITSGGRTNFIFDHRISPGEDLKLRDLR